MLNFITKSTANNHLLIINFNLTGEAGATVYVTGRSENDLDAVCKDIKERGGEGKMVVMDHSKDEDVEKLFQKIDK